MQDDVEEQEWVVRLETVPEMVGLVDELCASGDYDEALPVAELAVLKAREQGGQGVPLLADGLRVLTAARLCLGQFEAAETAASEALALVEQHALESQLAGALYHQAAVVCLHLAQPERAAPLLTQAAQQLESTSTSDYCAVMLTMAELAVEVGDAGSASDMYGDVLRRIGSLEPESEEHALEQNRITARAFLGLGSACARQGERAKARDYLSRVGEFFDTQPPGPERLAMLEHMVELWRVLGDKDALAAAEQELAALLPN